VTLPCSSSWAALWAGQPCEAHRTHLHPGSVWMIFLRTTNLFCAVATTWAGAEKHTQAKLSTDGPHDLQSSPPYHQSNSVLSCSWSSLWHETHSSFGHLTQRKLGFSEGTFKFGQHLVASYLQNMTKYKIKENKGVFLINSGKTRVYNYCHFIANYEERGRPPSQRKAAGRWFFQVSMRLLIKDKDKNMNKITRDCQKGGPPITASKCMIIMKICTSVTSILIKHRKPKRKAELLKAISSQLSASSAAALYHAQCKELQDPEENRRGINTLKSKNIF